MLNKWFKIAIFLCQYLYTISIVFRYLINNSNYFKNKIEVEDIVEVEVE